MKNNKTLHLVLTKNINSINIEYHLDLQKKIVDFFKNIKLKHNIKIKIYYSPKHIIENNLKDIDKNNDYVIWHPLVAHNNLTFLKTFKNSIVILYKKTVFLQKISENNPINENMAINHNFKILYIDNKNDDITNQDYRILGYENDFLITIDSLLKKLEN